MTKIIHNGEQNISDIFENSIVLPKVQTERWVLHVDLDAFYASVEQKLHPELIGKPVIVGPDPKLGATRGVVLTCSYEARKFGIHSAMSISQAQKLCPDAYYSFTGFKSYHEESKKVMEILEEKCKEIQQVSIDEAYTDISDLIPDHKPETVQLFSKELQQEVHEVTQLSISIGGSHTKAIAKICSQLAKPHGVMILPEVNFRAKLDPLPLNIISGVGKKTFAYLQSKGYNYIGDISKKKYTKLSPELRWIWLTVHGIVINDSRQQKSNRSHSKDRTMNEDVGDHILLRKIVRKLVTSLMSDLEGENFKTLTLKIRDSNFQTFTRSKTFQYFINPEKVIDVKLAIITANDLLNEFLLEDERRYRLLGIKASNFKVNDLIQTSIFDYIP